MRSHHVGSPLSRVGIVQVHARRSRAYRDIFVILAGSVVVFAVSAAFDIFNAVIRWIYRHDTWQLDEVFTVGIYLAIAMALYSWRRYRDLVDQRKRREEAEAEKARLVPALESANADVSALKKLIPICSSCRRLRDDRGYWNQVEEYLEIHLYARMDTGICPECARKLYDNGEHALRPENHVMHRSPQH